MRRPKVRQVESSASRTPEQKRDIKKTDKTILDNFYKLVNIEGHVRLTAALSTFKILAAMQRTNIEKFNEHLNYCIERLVAGLASPRALARRGYATLLLELLEHYQVSTKKLLTIGRDKFGELKKQSKDNLVGYHLLVTIILESGNWSKWNADKGSEYAEKMYELLDQLRNCKSYFEFPVNKLIVRYYDVFQPCMQSRNIDILNHLADPPLSALGKHAHTHLTESLFLRCSPNTLEAYLDKLLQTFSRKHPPETRKVYAFCAKQMTQLVRRLPSDLDPACEEINDHVSTKKIGKFLIINGILGSIDISRVPESFWQKHQVFRAEDTLHSSTRKALRAAYHSTLDHIVSTCHAKVRLEIVQELIEFADALLRKYKAVTNSYHSGQIVQQWEKYMACLKDHNSLITKKKNPNILFPLTSLYLLYGLQILEHGLECEEQLEELAVSAQEALKDDPNDGTWADVLTDQIIAILSATECNPWIRRLCVSVFGSLLPHISETSIDLICDVFKVPLGVDDEDDGDGGSLSGDEDADSDAMDGVVEERSGSEGQEEDAVGSDDDDEDDDDEEEDDDDDDDDDNSFANDDADKLANVDSDNLAESQPNGAKGPTKSKSDNLNGSDDECNHDDDDEDGDDEEYLDDDQMMKLDEHLVAMFKERSIGKKKKDPSFQLRCLDLVKKIIQKKHSDGELIRKVLATIVPFANKCRRHKETRVLAEKIHSIIPKKATSAVVAPQAE